MSDSNRRHTPSLGVISTIFGCVLLICFANSVSREDSRSFSIKKKQFGKGFREIFEGSPVFHPTLRESFKVYANNSLLDVVRYYRIEVVIFNINRIRDIIK